MVKEVFAYRLKAARKARGYSMEQLAVKVGISKQMISKYEKGKSLPGSALLIKFSEILGVPPGYFFEEPLVVPKEIKFRKKSKLPKREQEKILYFMTQHLEKYLQIEHILGMDSRFQSPLKEGEMQLFEELKPENAERLAEIVRKNWQIGTDPIANVIYLLEEFRIKVIEIENGQKDDTRFDGLASMIRNDVAVIVTKKFAHNERKRFTLLHELAHLLIDRHAKNVFDHNDEEAFCNRFAGAMLLPADAVMEYFGKNPRTIFFEELAFVQEKYGISIPAIMYRLKDLGIISENRFKNFFKVLNGNKNLKKIINRERFPGKEVSGRFEALVFKALSQDLITPGKAAELLGTDLEKIRDKMLM